MFEDFALERIDTGGAVLRVRHGGSAPPVLLLAFLLASFFTGA